MPDVRIATAGDAAITAEFPRRIAPEINRRVLAVAGAIGRRCGSSLRDVVIGYSTVTVYFDPLAVDAAWIEDELRRATSEPPAADTSAREIVDVPVCYGDDLGPDLDDVARFARSSAADVVARHSAITYTVYLVGFVPGFAYMAEVDPRIAAPRRASPRTEVPAGSVAIAGGQTGIYPSVTPGGWNIIGRTPLKPYDPARDDPFLFQPGHRVRFHQILRAEFDSCSSWDR